MHLPMEKVYVTANFDEGYNKLNEAQKIAVETTEGPVMVIAGPGTGKTQILSYRIGTILLRNLVEAKNILCLTYTDSGVTAMRKRLTSLIGPLSYEVGIFTFHAFCHRIISDNPESFHLYGDHSVADDLDIIECLEELLSSLPPDNRLFSYKENFAQTIKNLKKLFSDIKREHWSPDEMIINIQQRIADLKNDPEFTYKRKSGNNQKGDIKVEALEKEKVSLLKTIDAIKLFEKYQKALNNKNLYDYDDLILWVIGKFSTDDEFLGIYQEKYQYILVDEYQDTNGSQNELLNLLCSYWEQPNIFVVGDDDQAIYRFQGANLENMLSFKNKYNPEVILLTNNYRSSQFILDLAGHSIKSNLDRLINEIPNLSKDLLSSGENKNVATLPKIVEYSDNYSEFIDVINQIENLTFSKKVNYKEIAVLVRKNKEISNYSLILQKKGIPFKASFDINAIQEPIIITLLEIMKYLHQETINPFSSDHLLYKILHQPFVSSSSLDIARISWHLNQLDKNLEINHSSNEYLNISSLRLLLSDSDRLTTCGISYPEKILEFSNALESIIKEINSLTLQVLVEKILYSLKILPYILESPERDTQLQIVNGFFDFLKDQSVKNPEIDLDKFLKLIDRIEHHQLSIPVTLFTGAEDGVYLSTLHKSKGLEFQYVFMVNNTKNNWRAKNESGFKLVEPFRRLNKLEHEDERRLFYVGITRAKNFIQISYPVHSLSGKSLEPCLYIAELLEFKEIEKINKSIETSDFISGIEQRITYFNKPFVQIDENYYKIFLDRFELASTALNTYLECPLKFYYEKVLRIPGARSAPMGFGNAIHKALENFFKNRTLDPNGPDIDLLLNHFNKAMLAHRSHFTSREFQNYLEEGKKSLTGFINQHYNNWLDITKMEPEYDFRNRTYRNVPIIGNIDRVDHYPTNIKVVDYKTGNANSIRDHIKRPSEKNPFGGTYWRQLIFYSILMDTESQFNGKMSSGLIYYVNPDNYGKYLFSEIFPSTEDKLLVGNLIVDTYAKIQNKQFFPGCQKPECVWCNFYTSGALSQNDDIEES
ncbi:MAG TPA: ATP-dependent DNA helicase [Saprospiraceae bacterium]|nr:ATP-dependent DNA helicase [Saprospiraceae bacterium]